MAQSHKILLVDDDPALLELFAEFLARLPSRPEIRTASSGSKALAMLQDEPYKLLICDLKMPKMDGLQVLSVARRKFPQVRTVAVTALPDEQYRSRTYALGVDLFWHKPAGEQEISLFLECMESLLGQDSDAGFRGVQSKSLMDIIQLECMSQSSALLRITNGPLTGKIWILDGEIVDAESDDLRGEPAFRRIFSWRAGGFEILPAEPGRPRTIFTSYNALLLESAQVLDEAQQNNGSGEGETNPALARLSEVEGVEFLMARRAGAERPEAARGLENPERIGAWARQSLERFRELGDRLHAGALELVHGTGPQRQVTLAQQDNLEFCVGWRHSMPTQRVRDAKRKVMALWVS